MNKLKIIFLFLLPCLHSFAQKDEEDEIKLSGPVIVSPVVLDSFKVTYPNVTNATWDYGDGFYEVVFSNNGVDMTVDYDVLGHCQETETEISVDELPLQAKDYILKNYSSFKLTSASKLVTDHFDVAYVAQIGKQATFWDITFDEKGKFLKEEEAD